MDKLYYIVTKTKYLLIIRLKEICLLSLQGVGLTQFPVQRYQISQ